MDHCYRRVLRDFQSGLYNEANNFPAVPSSRHRCGGIETHFRNDTFCFYQSQVSHFEFWTRATAALCVGDQILWSSVPLTPSSSRQREGQTTEPASPTHRLQLQPLNDAFGTNTSPAANKPTNQTTHQTYEPTNLQTNKPTKQQTYKPTNLQTTTTDDDDGRRRTTTNDDDDDDDGRRRTTTDNDDDDDERRQCNNDNDNATTTAH